MFAFLKRAPKHSNDRILYGFFRNVFGIRPNNLYLYRLALTHRSVSINESQQIRLNNERLEYLGDAVLSSVVADFLFKKYPFQEEGFLTEMRSKIVSRSSLNKLSQKIGLSEMVVYQKDGNCQFRSIDGDAFEAVVGAMYLDKGYAYTSKVIINKVLNTYMDVDLLEHSDWNFKSKLIDWGQREKKKITFTVIEILGEKHKKEYKTQVYIDEDPQEVGVGFSIKASEQLAAEKTFKKMELV